MIEPILSRLIQALVPQIWLECSVEPNNDDDNGLEEVGEFTDRVMDADEAELEDEESHR